ncbi:Leucine-rich repeat-containing N-terminal, plant-type [Sesbania bispinosa]|nr:Leucine-rich repeat-containing N-terminal, plant-type [Sesbania bispinosa]
MRRTTSFSCDGGLVRGARLEGGGVAMREGETSEAKVARDRDCTQRSRLVRNTEGRKDGGNVDTDVCFPTDYLSFTFNLLCSLIKEGKDLLKLKQRIVSDPFGALSNWVDVQVAVDLCNWFGVECSRGGVVVL